MVPVPFYEVCKKPVTGATGFLSFTVIAIPGCTVTASVAAKAAAWNPLRKK
jgi:hypothetical protein